MLMGNTLTKYDEIPLIHDLVKELKAYMGVYKEVKNN